MMLSFSFSLPAILSLVSLLMLAIATVLSSFLIYHWYAYADTHRQATRATVLYLLGVFGCFGGMAFAILLTT